MLLYWILQAIVTQWSILCNNIIILWDHRRICGTSLTETSLCGAYLYNIAIRSINWAKLSRCHAFTWWQKCQFDYRKQYGGECLIRHLRLVFCDWQSSPSYRGYDHACLFGYNNNNNNNNKTRNTFLIDIAVLNTHNLSVDKKNQLDVTFVFFISLLLVAQHVSGNHVPVIRS